MIFDLNSDVPLAQLRTHFDVVIIGSGAAGISLAIRLRGSGLKIALIEAGGLERSELSQAIYRGSVIGDPYFELDNCRLRYFGGTTNHWGGWCRTFDEHDFDRSYLGDHLLWPISKSSLDPYLTDACDILEINSDFNDSVESDSNLIELDFKFSPPVRFSEKYLDILSNDENITLFLNANLTDISGSRGRINNIVVNNFNNGQFDVSGNKFVLAAGGIENSRYLLIFQDKYQNFFFNTETPIGKYWMEHPHFEFGEMILFSDEAIAPFYGFSGKLLADLSVLNCGLRISPLNSADTNTLFENIVCRAPNLGKRLYGAFGEHLACGARIGAAWEQLPVENNRIMLSRQVDQFGLPLADLYWRKSPIDRETIVKLALYFNDWILSQDLGRLHFEPWFLGNGNYPANAELGGNHHLGGTRMHQDPAYGVVDENLKVYGSDNLYVLGSSVFTTGGHCNPTLPIVQFALRLGDHIVST